MNYSIVIKNKLIEYNKIVGVEWDYIGDDGKSTSAIQNTFIKDFDENTTDNQIIEVITQEYNLDRMQIQIELSLKEK
jgi:hypothetical protein